MTNAQRTQLLKNGRKSRETDDFDPPPVLKLFTSDANATWLLTEIDPASSRSPGVDTRASDRAGVSEFP